MAAASINGQLISLEFIIYEGYTSSWKGYKSWVNLYFTTSILVLAIIVQRILIIWCVPELFPTNNVRTDQNH